MTLNTVKGSKTNVNIILFRHRPDVILHTDMFSEVWKWPALGDAHVDVHWNVDMVVQVGPE